MQKASDCLRPIMNTEPLNILTRCAWTCLAGGFEDHRAHDKTELPIGRSGHWHPGAETVRIVKSRLCSHGRLCFRGRIARVLGQLGLLEQSN